MKKYDELIQFILENIGGINNVISVNHCATRLRLKLTDVSQLDEEKLKTNAMIMGIVKRENEIQLVIGPDVPKVYARFSASFDQQKEKATEIAAKKSLKAYGSAVVDFISGTFVPVLPILVAAGLVSAVLNIGVTFFGIGTESGTYTILNAVNNAGFYYLPIFIGFSAAKKLEINGMLGMFLGAILVHASIDGIANLDFLSIPVPTTTYNTTTIPVIFGVLFMALIDRLGDRIIPQAIKYFLKPLLVILITVPVTLIILGPLGNIVGGFIADGLGFMYEHLGWLSVGIVGAVTPLLVMTGTNQALFPLVFAMLGDYGYDSFVLPAMLAANVAVGAAALAISSQEKEIDKRSLSLSSGITGIMGVTEPAIFGVLINYSSAFFGAIIGGGLGGIFAGLVQLKQYAVVSPGIAAIPTFIPTDGEGLNRNFWFSILTIVLSISISFGVTIFLQKQTSKKQKLKQAAQAIKITSPLTGKVVPLQEVHDPMFADKMMGDGLAILPTEGEVVSPIDGYVIMTTPTNHAIGLRGDNGVEILIHIGMDTVELNGRFYQLHVTENQYVHKGASLITFDLENIAAAGYDLTTPIIVTNPSDHEPFAKTVQENVNREEYLYSVK